MMFLSVVVVVGRCNHFRYRAGKVVLGRIREIAAGDGCIDCRRIGGIQHRHSLHASSQRRGHRPQSFVDWRLRRRLVSQQRLLAFEESCANSKEVNDFISHCLRKPAY